MALNDIKVPKENSSGTFDEITLPDATTSSRGLLTSADKTKLDGIAAGAEVNVNADWNASSGDAQILNKPTSLTPTSHAASHAAAGSDPVTLDVSQVASVNGFGNVWGGGESLADVFTNAGDMFYANQSDFAAASHAHGNLTADGKVGSTSGLPLKTGTAGVVEAGAFGTSAGTFCEGNDARLSNARTPTAHTHAASDITSGLAASATTDTTNASNISSGTLATARMGSGTPSASNYLRGDGSWQTVTAGVGGSTGATDNALLRADGTGGAAVQDSALVIDDATTSPQNNVALRNNHTETNSSLVLCNKGAGAFIVSPARPDATSSGGNSRGASSVCIVPSRNNANQVASGANAVAIGAQARAGGSQSVAIGFGSTDGTGNNAVAIGHGASATTESISIGYNVVSAWGAVSIGQSNASGTNSVSLGSSSNSSLRAQLNCRPFAAVYWGGQTTNNTATILNLDAAATNRMTIAANTALAVDILLVARRSDVADKWLVARRFLGIRRDGSNNTALIGAVQTLGTDQSAGSPTWNFTLTADDTNDALQLEVTGATGETVQWRATAIYRVV